MPTSWARPGVTQALAVCSAWSEGWPFAALPGLDSFLGRWKVWLPGTWGRTGVGFCFPIPSLLTAVSSGEPLSRPPKMPNGLSGFNLPPFSEDCQGLFPSVSLPAPSSWGSERWSGFLKVTERALGQSQQTPFLPSLPQCCLGHISSAGESARLCPVS